MAFDEKEAREALLAIGEIAHDALNAVTVLLTRIDLALHRADDPIVIEELDVALAAARKLAPALLAIQDHAVHGLESGWGQEGGDD